MAIREFGFQAMVLGAVYAMRGHATPLLVKDYIGISIGDVKKFKAAAISVVLNRLKSEHMVREDEVEVQGKYGAMKAPAWSITDAGVEHMRDHLSHLLRHYYTMETFLKAFVTRFESENDAKGYLISRRKVVRGDWDVTAQEQTVEAIAAWVKLRPPGVPEAIVEALLGGSADMDGVANG